MSIYNGKESQIHSLRFFELLSKPFIWASNSVRTATKVMAIRGEI
uniref:Uncharacterized protein n=1 Tax=Rhizophora mucronata TaxID=61149 RepID=A0A2P2K0R4_RHIMU